MIGYAIWTDVVGTLGECAVIGAMNRLAASPWAVCCSPSPQPPLRRRRLHKAQREIEQLIIALGSSGCQFQRNGNWYPASEAQSHLRRKYEWLRKRDMVDSAEQFIARAGSESSMTGKPYQVRCPGQPTATSSAWLSARLAAIRHATP